MNGNLWVWEQARPKIPSLPCPPATGAGEGVGTGIWPVLGDDAPKKVTPWGVTRQGDAAPVASASSMFLSPLTTLHSGVLSTFLRHIFGMSHMGTISERRKCRSDEPSGISNMIQMGEFSQTTCIADDQANHRSQPRDVGEAPSLPIRGPAPTGTHNVVTVSFWSGENHRACAASISDPHQFLAVGSARYFC